MRLKRVYLKNFRSYRETVAVDMGALTVFTGKNDIGKSTILEALDLFFNEGNGLIKFDAGDLNISASRDGESEIEIGVVFGGAPEHLVIDATSQTSLADEFLLNEDGDLEIVKVFSTGKPKVYINALHPTNVGCKDLLTLTNAKLKEKIPNGVECNRVNNVSIREAIWSYYSEDLKLQPTRIEASKIDSKDLYEALKKYFPSYALFQSDRSNSDSDGEVQNPMKYAVQEIMKDPNVVQALDDVANVVTARLQQVADATLEKLSEMDADVARKLNPVIPAAADLKWADVFKKVSIAGDDDIPINKRGSGVKRLVLLNFFRAEVERRRMSQTSTNVIYAIEEPETSQHPNYQRDLIDAIKALSTSGHTQVILTTHSPVVVKSLDFDDLRVIVDGDAKQILGVDRTTLPYPSMNEVNYHVFDEADSEYHNELYGFIEANGWLTDFEQDKLKVAYTEVRKGVAKSSKMVTKNTYIRHQIHHPENTINPRFTRDELDASIAEMRKYIAAKQNEVELA
ncbi:MAG: ATP-binding protein [Cellvibrio sp.]